MEEFQSRVLTRDDLDTLAKREKLIMDHHHHHEDVRKRDRLCSGLNMSRTENDDAKEENTDVDDFTRTVFENGGDGSGDDSVFLFGNCPFYSYTHTHT